MKQQINNLTPQQKTDPCKISPPKKPDTNTPQEIGGVKGPEPTRFGDWEKNGRCIDF